MAKRTAANNTEDDGSTQTVKQTEQDLKIITSLIQRHHAQVLIVENHKKRLNGDEFFKKWANAFVEEAEAALQPLDEFKDLLFWIQAERSTAQKARQSAKLFMQKHAARAAELLKGVQTAMHVALTKCEAGRTKC